MGLGGGGSTIYVHNTLKMIKLNWFAKIKSLSLGVIPKDKGLILIKI